MPVADPLTNIKPRNKHTPPPKEVTLEREKKIWELRAQFKSLYEIAAEVGMSPAGVAVALKRISKRYNEEFRERIEEVRIQQTQSLGYIMMEAKGAWDRSKLDAEETTEVTGGPHGAVTTVKNKGQCGDPRYLDIIVKAMADVRTIWGIDAPTKVSPVDVEGNPFVLKVIHGVSMDDL